MNLINIGQAAFYLIASLLVVFAPLGITEPEKLLIIYGIGFCLLIGMNQELKNIWQAPVTLGLSFIGLFYYPSLILLAFIIILSELKRNYKDQSTLFLFISLLLLFFSLPYFNQSIVVRYLSLIAFLLTYPVMTILGNLSLDRLPRLWLELFYSMFLLGYVLTGLHNHFLLFHYVLVFIAFIMLMARLNRTSIVLVVLYFVTQAGLFAEPHHYSLLLGINLSYSLPFVSALLYGQNIPDSLNVPSIIYILSLLILAFNFRNLFKGYRDNFKNFVAVVPGLIYIGHTFFYYFLETVPLKRNGVLLDLAIPCFLLAVAVLSSFLEKKGALNFSFQNNWLGSLEKYLCQATSYKAVKENEGRIYSYKSLKFHYSYRYPVAFLILFFSLSGALFWIMKI